MKTIYFLLVKPIATCYNQRMKTCKKCGSTKSESEFYAAKNCKDGLSGTCKACKREYSKRWLNSLSSDEKSELNRMQRERYYGNKVRFAERKKRFYYTSREITHDRKASFGCLRCGEKDPYALDFHHIAEKVANIGNGSKVPRKVIESELGKCIVLCANCHRKLHAGSWSIEEVLAQMLDLYPEAWALWVSLEIDRSNEPASG